MRILLYCPMHPKTPKLFGRTNQSIFRLEYEPLEIWFSKGDNPYPQENADGRRMDRSNILHNYAKARQMALVGGFDYLFTVEYDMVIPSDAIERLLACDADVAYGLYCFRATSRLSAYLKMERRGGVSIDQEPDVLREHWGKRLETEGVGLGCTLIRRKVLEELEFRTEDGAANDWFFALDLVAGGYKQVHDLGLLCGHITLNPSPRVLWPDIDLPKFYRNDFIDGIPVNDKGEVELEIGSLGEFYIPKDALVRRLDE